MSLYRELGREGREIVQTKGIKIIPRGEAPRDYLDSRGLNNFPTRPPQLTVMALLLRKW